MGFAIFRIFTTEPFGGQTGKGEKNQPDRRCVRPTRAQNGWSRLVTPAVADERPWTRIDRIHESSFEPEFWPVGPTLLLCVRDAHPGGPPAGGMTGVDLEPEPIALSADPRLPLLDDNHRFKSNLSLWVPSKAVFPFCCLPRRGETNPSLELSDYQPVLIDARSG